MQSREVHLIKRPEGLPVTDDFRVVETQVGEPADGEVLVQNLYMSVDPAMRPQMSRGYELGKPMMGGGPEHMHLQEEFSAKMTGWLKEGRIQYRETVLDGIDAAPQAMVGLMQGQNIGKMLVQLA